MQLTDVVRKALEVTALRHPDLMAGWQCVAKDAFCVSTPWGQDIRVYAVPSRSVWKHTHGFRGLSSSRHFVMIVRDNFSEDEVQCELAGKLRGYWSGHRAEEIALAACALARNLRPDLIVDFYKTGTIADKFEGVDIRVGFSHSRNGRLEYFSYDVKSSPHAAKLHKSNNGKTRMLIFPAGILRNPAAATEYIVGKLIREGEALQKRRH